MIKEERNENEVVIDIPKWSRVIFSTSFLYPIPFPLSMNKNLIVYFMMALYVGQGEGIRWKAGGGKQYCASWLYGHY